MSKTTDTGTVEGAATSVDAIRYTAVCEGRLGADTLTTAVNSMGATLRRQWGADMGRTEPVHEFKPGFTWKVTTVVNSSPLVVALGDGRSSLGDEAHGALIREYFVLLTDTGRIVPDAKMIAELERAIGAQKFADQVSRAFGSPAGTISRLDPDDVSIYPTADHLVISVPSCAPFACDLGMLEERLAWRDILPAGTDLSFVPDSWGW